MACLALAGGCGPARAELRLADLFSDHAVLQRSGETKIWGWARPGAVVTVSLAGERAEAVAGADGRWETALDLRETPPGPHTLTADGDGKAESRDVLAGEVWLASGQSNMQWTLRDSLGGPEEAARARNPMVRQFLVKPRAEEEPAEDIRGRWMLAVPEQAGEFSAVGYYFATRLNQELGTPVAVINASWGGSSSEAWTSREALASDPVVGARADRVNRALAEFERKKAEFARAFAEFVRRTGRADPSGAAGGLKAPGADKDWRPVRITSEPGPAEARPGVIWLRREVTLPPDAGGKPLRVRLGRAGLFARVFWNGELIAENTFEKDVLPQVPLLVDVPGRLARAGANSLAVRIYSPGTPPSLRPRGWRFLTGRVPFEGEWLFHQELVFDGPAPEMPEPPPPLPEIQHRPARLFNGMIAPLVPAALAGVIWYQGESNTGRAFEYRQAFPLLIADWRGRWGRPELPFYWCQLAGFMEKKDTPGESGWAELREAQTLALRLPATGQAVLLDAGEAQDIHPRDKRTPGERLAAIALARRYGKNVPFTGPVYEGFRVEGDKMRIRFSDTGGGLVARELPAEYPLTKIPPASAPLRRNSPGSELEGFAVCGEDRRWVWADARIEGDTVVVWSPQAPRPVAARYAWADNPTGNLWGANGLPAGPFRTDTFPLSTEINPEK